LERVLTGVNATYLEYFLYLEKGPFVLKQRGGTGIMGRAREGELCRDPELRVNGTVIRNKNYATSERGARDRNIVEM
jgi:hypothetical protein